MAQSTFLVYSNIHSLVPCNIYVASPLRVILLSMVIRVMHCCPYHCMMWFSFKNRMVWTCSFLYFIFLIRLYLIHWKCVLVSISLIDLQLMLDQVAHYTFKQKYSIKIKRLQVIGVGEPPSDRSSNMEYRSMSLNGCTIVETSTTKRVHILLPVDLSSLIWC